MPPLTEAASDPILVPAVRTHFLAATDRWFVVAVLLAIVAAVYRDIVGHTTVVFIGTYNLTTADPVFVVAALALVQQLRHRSLTIRDSGAVLLLLFALLICLSVFRGLLVNTFESIVSLRNTGVLAIFSALTLFCTPSSPGLVYTRRILIAAGCVLVLLLLVRLVLGPATFYQAAYLTPSDINDGGRGLGATGCVLIAAAAVVVLSDVRRAPRFATAVIFLLLWGGLLASRQVTATLAGCAGIAVILFLERGPARLARQLVLVGAVFVGLLTYALSAPVEQPQRVPGDVERRVRNLEARQHIWRGLLADYADWSVVDKLVGLPAGVKPRIQVPFWGGVLWKLSIHSMYLGTLVYAGALGLIVYIGILIQVTVTAAANLHREWSQAAPFTPVTAVAFCAIVAVFGFSYEIRNEVSIILTVAAVAAHAAQISDAAPKSPLCGTSVR